MTAQKSFKRRVRARMAKTGERYTAARRQLLAAGPPTPSQPSEPPPNPDGGTRRIVESSSEEALRANTGRGWSEWFALLDDWGATGRSHTEIARWLVEEQKVHGWWAQSIAVTYEQARGMRIPGQGPDGFFTASASKTIAVPALKAFEAFADDALRERWLPGAMLTVTTNPTRDSGSNSCARSPSMPLPGRRWPGEPWLCTGVSVPRKSARNLSSSSGISSSGPISIALSRRCKRSKTSSIRGNGSMARGLWSRPRRSPRVGPAGPPPPARPPRRAPPPTPRSRPLGRPRSV
jgi:hypothetical protein